MPGIQMLNKGIKEAVKTKKNLKLMPNHYKTQIVPRRVFNSGQAIKDNKGWYR